MFIGLLIGFTLFGLLIFTQNNHRPADPVKLQLIRSIMRVIGLFFFIIGLCGAIGWIID